MDKNIEEYLRAPSIKLEEWKKIADSSLKDKTVKDLEKLLDNNISTKPLYTETDIDDDFSLSSRRGLSNDTDQFMPWYICSTIDHSNNPKTLNARILNELERGSNSLELSSFNEGSLNDILKSVDTAIAPIYFKNLKDPLEKINEYQSYLSSFKGLNKKEPMGGYLIDPIATNLWLKEFSEEKFGETIEHQNLLEKTININSNYKNIFPKIEIIHIDGSLWDDLGAGLSKEIELIASSYLEILRYSKNNYNEVKDINITISSNTNFFATIAKIRSIRIIFNNIFKHFKITGKLNITSRNSSNIIFKEDPWVNQLRITTSALSAAIGGVDKIICNNITQKLGQAPDFIKRLTRNTHIILQEESRISRVQDPSGGSFYVEKLTNDLSQNAWNNIKLIEKMGGITSLTSSEDFVVELRKSREKLKKDIEDKNIKKIGVNIFEDPDSNPINVRPFEEAL
ncbi:methylmalonyl-CoA mutase family protein [Rhodobiaceae bacterium]|nr:methylmalonyl-CoA mutase family protein [Rhodobiaceae bacterium]